MFNYDVRWRRALLYMLLACTLCNAHMSVADPAGRTPRTIALTCCERSDEAWTILSAWQRSCAKATSRSALTSERYAAMLSLQSRSSVPPAVVTAVCDDASLSLDAIAAYLQHALCTSLPRTHGDLARSVYSPLMDEAPALEDELTDDIESACHSLQDRWATDVGAWAWQLRTQTTLSAAQNILCSHPCRWKEDTIDGTTYDL